MPRAAVVDLSDLDKYLEVSRENAAACMDAIDHDLHVDGVTVTLRFHYLKFDQNGVPKFRDLAKCLADHLIGYSFSTRRRGKPTKHFDWSKLRREARDLLRRTATAGEAGEILLYFLEEAVLGAPQMVAKMDLKTNPKFESLGSDGIHMKWHDVDQCLDIYHGESKLEQSAADALDHAFASLEKFHADDIATHELGLVTSHYKWASGPLKKAVLQYVDRGKAGGDCRVNHACLIGYDWKLYKKLVQGDAAAVTVEFCRRYSERAPRLRDLLERRFKKHKLTQFRFEFFFLPFASVQEFRDAFNKAV